MDRGAWQAAVHGVAQSRTRLKQLGTKLCSLFPPHPFPLGPLAFSMSQLPRLSPSPQGSASGLSPEAPRLSLVLVGPCTPGLHGHPTHPSLGPGQEPH